LRCAGGQDVVDNAADGPRHREVAESAKQEAADEQDCLDAVRSQIGKEPPEDAALEQGDFTHVLASTAGTAGRRAGRAGPTSRPDQSQSPVPDRAR